MNEDGNKQKHTHQERRKTKQGNVDNIKNSVRTISPAIMLLEKKYVHTFILTTIIIVIRRAIHYKYD
jgi:hypothetical protein